VSLRAALLLSLCWGLSACQGQTGRPAPRTAWLPTYGFGAFGGGDVDMRDFCPNGAVAELSVGSTWATLGVSVATLGVYTPREVRVQCAAR